MVEGWILDTYLDEKSEKIVLWIKDDCGKVTKHFIRWTSYLHVKADLDDLQKLEKIKDENIKNIKLEKVKKFKKRKFKKKKFYKKKVK